MTDESGWCHVTGSGLLLRIVGDDNAHLTLMKDDENFRDPQCLPASGSNKCHLHALRSTGGLSKTLF